MPEENCVLCGTRILQHQPRWVVDKGEARVCIDCVESLVLRAVNQKRTVMAVEATKA